MKWTEKSSVATKVSTLASLQWKCGTTTICLTLAMQRVEQSGKIDAGENSTKVCSSRIKIKAELKLADIINIGVEWLKDITSPSKVKADGVLNDNGNRRKQIGSSGYYAQIDSTGEDSVI